MTSAARTDARGGFTLLEIVVVIALIAIVLGSAVGAMYLNSEERILTDASGEVELLAKQARTTAIFKQTPYALEFREGVARVLPLALAGMDEKTTAGGRRIGGEKELPPATAEYHWDPEIHLSVRRWNSTEWLSVGKKAIHVWRFDPEGISEPLSIRYNTEKSWLEDTFHPLTATIQDTQSEIH